MIKKLKTTSKKKLALATLGAGVAVVVGVVIVYGSVMATFGVYSSEQYMFEPLVFGAFGLFFTLILYFISRVRSNSFMRGMRIISLFGIFGVTAILLLFSAGVIREGIDSMDQQAVASGCAPSVKDKVSLALAATIPISTNLGTGTGFYVTADAKVITAFHVIDGASEVSINLVGKKIELGVIDTAPDYDLALLQPTLPLGRSVDYLRLHSNYQVGDEVMAVGYPANTLSAGYASVSGGLISRTLDHEGLKLNEIEAPLNLEIVQTDTAVNPGNSGGALIDRCGVVGVVSFKSDRNQLQDYGLVSEEGISFTVSSKSVAARFSLPLED